MTIPLETTDITLFVRTSGEDIVRWNRQRIVEALIRETGVDVDTAETISRDVEKQIVSSGISLLTTPLIRELDEMAPAFTAPYTLDSSAAEDRFGLAPTPWKRALTETVAWLRR